MGRDVENPGLYLPAAIIPLFLPLRISPSFKPLDYIFSYHNHLLNYDPRDTLPSQAKPGSGNNPREDFSMANL